MEFPRDIQLQILKHVDMDTRIKLGLIGKLQVPDHVKKIITSIPKVKKIAFRDTYYVELGFNYDIGDNVYVIDKMFPKYDVFITFYEKNRSRTLQIQN